MLNKIVREFFLYHFQNLPKTINERGYAQNRMGNEMQKKIRREIDVRYGCNGKHRFGAEMNVSLFRWTRFAVRFALTIIHPKLFYVLVNILFGKVL